MFQGRAAVYISGLDGNVFHAWTTVFHFWTAVFQTWTAVCFWLEPLSWPRPLCVLGLDGCVSGLDRYVFQAWTAYFSGLDRCVSGLDRSVFQAWTGTLCVSGLGRYVFQAWTGPLCVSGLDWTALCFRLGPLCFRLGPLCVSGLDRFSEDLEAMLGHRPGRYWMVCWKFVAPVFLVVSMVTVCSDI